jgi:hypothetical protein
MTWIWVSSLTGTRKSSAELSMDQDNSVSVQRIAVSRRSG